jgi:hypothetical protein
MKKLCNLHQNLLISKWGKWLSPAEEQPTALNCNHVYFQQARWGLVKPHIAKYVLTNAVILAIGFL